MNETGRCPFAKKRKLEDESAVQGGEADLTNTSDDLRENLKQFHVLDEVQGDNSDDDGNYEIIDFLDHQ